jgi:hypothetical protein
LYRPGKTLVEINSPAFDGDYRQPFNEALIDKHAKLLAKISPHEKKAIILFYKGCMNFIITKYKLVFSKTDDSNEPSDPFNSFVDLVGILADNEPDRKPIIRKQLLYDVLDTLEKERIKAIELEEKYGNK